MLALIFIMAGTESFSQGNLLITPRRVVFEGSKRSMDLNLANTGQDTATYAISVVQIRMTEEGGFETITEPDPGQFFADANIRFFPRSVTLGPNEAQVVKVQVVRKNELADGEYRSHFYFRAIPKVDPLGQEEAAAVDSTTISVRITPVFGITIPVIIRAGNSQFSVTLSDISLDLGEANNPRINFVFNRSGNASVYGDITVDHISPSGTVTRVGIANGVAVYTPNTIRRFGFNLSNVEGIDFGSGRLKVTFSSANDAKSEIFAEAEVLLQR
ncbi:MAG: molecular chaperone [Bacteroidia bacterium]|nr:MAG: molecular chaperone [Bacteroidia bacterium]